MKVLVTGAKGFIGKNLVTALLRSGVDVAQTDIDSAFDSLLEGVRGASAVFHLAGINRPEKDEEFVPGNVGPLVSLFEAIDQVSSDRGLPRPLIVLSSSVQAVQGNPYGVSKQAAEQALEDFSSRTGTPSKIYRLPGVFGKWCLPNYNSVVATFCHNIARGLPINISDPGRIIDLVHIDDVIAEFMTCLTASAQGVLRAEVRPIFSISLGDLAARITAFHAKQERLEIVDTSDPFVRRLFGTYSSYLPPERITSLLGQRKDNRGTLVELLKGKHSGQFFISRSHPGIIRGNHYHDLKVEKFYVVEGEALIRMRPLMGDQITEYRVTGRDFRVTEIPPGVTHSIENVGTTEMIVLFWASEIFDPERPDTYPAEV